MSERGAGASCPVVVQAESQPVGMRVRRRRNVALVQPAAAIFLIPDPLVQGGVDARKKATVVPSDSDPVLVVQHMHSCCCSGKRQWRTSQRPAAVDAVGDAPFRF